MQCRTLIYMKCIHTLLPPLLLQQANNNRGPKMPYFVNNVDATVVANTLYGLASLFLSHPHIQYEKYTELLELMLYNAKLLEYVLRKELLFTPHGFLVPFFYPPLTNFYWFVGRVMHLLNSHDLENIGNIRLRTCLEEIREILTTSMRSHGTQQILRLASKEGRYTLWDEFLGNGDYPFPEYEDRVFSTATACNALMDIWAIKVQGGGLGGGAKTLVWVENTPQTVKEAVEGGFLAGSCAH